jgi:hypothetical protein
MGAIMAGETLRGLEEEMAALGGAEAAAAGLLGWLEWVEMEVQGLDELVEDLRMASCVSDLSPLPMAFTAYTL